MSEKMDYGRFGKFGAVGIMLALITLLSGCMYFYYKTVSNHIEHNTNALTEVTKVIEGNTEVIRSLDTTLKSK